jgi:hypothetical protein
MTTRPIVPYYLGRPARIWIAAMSRHTPAGRVHEGSTKEHVGEAVAFPLPPLPGVSPLTVEVREIYASA